MRYDTHRLVEDLTDAGVKMSIEIHVIQGVIDGGFKMTWDSEAKLSSNDWQTIKDTYDAMVAIVTTNGYTEA